MKRALHILAIGMAAVVLLLVGGSAAVYYLVGFDRIANEAIARARPQVEEAIGRKLRIGPVRTGFFPTLSVHVPDIAVEAERPDEPPLLEIAAVEVDIALWKAISTFGKALEIRDVTVRGPRVVVVRRPDGTFSYDDLLAKASAKEAPAEDEPAEGPSPIEGLRLGRLRVLDGALYLLDGSVPAGADLVASALSWAESIDLIVENVGRGETVTLDLSLAALAREKNVRLGLRAGPLHEFPPRGMPPLRDLTVRADGVELRALGAFLDESGKPLDEARLTARLAIPRFAPNEPVAIDGDLRIDRLRMEGGAPFDARAVAKAEIHLAEGDAIVESLLVDVGGMRLSARGAIRSATTLPRFEGFELRSEDVRLERILALAPQLGGALPPGARIEGPLHLEVASSGDAAAQSVQARLDLADADLHLPGALAKPRGVPFGFFANVDLDPTQARLREVRLRAANLDLQVQGVVTSFAPPGFDLRLEAAPFDFDGLVRLAPTVAESLAASGARAGGKGTIAGHLKGEAGRYDVDLRLGLLGAALAVPQAEIQGDLSLAARFSGDPATAWTAALDLDGGQSRLFVPEVVDKAPQTPLRAKVEVRRTPDRLDLPAFDVQLGALRLDAEGGIDLRGGGSNLVVTLPRADLPRLRATFPALPETWTASGHVEGALRVEGDPLRPGSIALAIPSFSGRIGRSDFTFSASVRNLEAPVMEADFRSSFLDLDALLGNEDEEQTGASKAGAGPKEDRPELRKAQATVRLAVDRARFTGRDLSRVAATVVLRDGVLTLEEAGFDLYGGRVSAAGTRAEIWKGEMPYDVRLAVRGLDVQAALAGEAKGAKLLSGRGDLELAVRGVGTDREDFEKNMTGRWSLSMKEGRITGPDLSASALGALREIPAFGVARLPSERNLRDLFAAFEIANGQMNLREPLRLALGQGRMELGGGVGIFGDLRLQGHYALPPAFVASLSGGRCKTDRPVEIPLAITGSPSAPAVRADGQAIARSLAERCLAGQVEAAAEKLLGKEAVEKARALEDGARKEAEAAAARAREEAEARKRELERKAEQAKKQAEKKAQDAAKKAADQARKRLGF